MSNHWHAMCCIGAFRWTRRGCEALQRLESDALAPAFPRGYTVIGANGSGGADCHTANETSRIVVIVRSETELRRRRYAAS